MQTTEKPPYALVLAGGSGRRFWPVSRDSHPKQLLNLFGGRTMIEETVVRLEGLVPPENILVLTNPVQEKGIRDALSDLIPPENIIAEPERRDTAPAIALAVAWVAAKDPEATMMVLPADHLIKDAPAFRDAMARATGIAATTDALVTLGIRPSWPCPSYGYIERAEEAALPDGLPDGPPVFDVARFREKPDAEKAREFLKQGNFTWNAGIFVWSIPTVRAEFANHCHELAQFVTAVANSESPDDAAAAGFGSLPKLSIDFALMEKASRVLNIEATFDWDDLGSWISVSHYLDNDGAGNRANTPISPVSSNGNIIFCDDGTHVGLLGVDDLVIVRTGDSLLIAKKDDADRIRQLTDVLPPELLS